VAAPPPSSEHASMILAHRLSNFLPLSTTSVCVHVLACV
jgi:hypothetical protein